MTKVIKFSSTTCVPCKLIIPVWNNLTREFADSYEFVPVVMDVDTDSEYVQRYSDVRSVPTILVERDGVEVARHVGADMSGRLYKAMLNAQLDK